MGCFIILKSITYAQRASGLLSRLRIPSSIIKPPVSLGKGSCSYALKIKYGDMKKAVDAIRGANIPISGVYTLEEGYYREVTA